MGYIPQVSRRSFVAGSVAAGGGFALGFHLPFGSSEALPMMPITGIGFCCARATSGHAIAAAPTTVMKRRRFTR